MKRISRSLDLVVALLILASLLGLSACGGGGASVKASAKDAEVGKDLQADNWKVTLKGVAEKVKVVGQGTGQGGGTYTADGIYVAVPVTLANNASDTRLMPGQGFFLLRDDQGKQYELTEQNPQIAYVRDLQGIRVALIVTPIDPGVPQDGYFLFDVPENVKGLELIVKGADGSIKLGF
jgi:hypothetical protein